MLMRVRVEADADASQGLRQSNGKREEIVQPPEQETTSPSESGPMSFDASANHDVESRIRHRAYELYCSRGQIDGNELDDWLEAERQLHLVRAPTDG